MEWTRGFPVDPGFFERDVFLDESYNIDFVFDGLSIGHRVKYQFSSINDQVLSILVEKSLFD
jgi:hypothetical protein